MAVVSRYSVVHGLQGLLVPREAQSRGQISYQDANVSSREWTLIAEHALILHPRLMRMLDLQLPPAIQLTAFYLEKSDAAWNEIAGRFVDMQHSADAHMDCADASKQAHQGRDSFPLLLEPPTLQCRALRFSFIRQLKKPRS